MKIVKSCTEVSGKPQPIGIEHIKGGTIFRSESTVYLRTSGGAVALSSGDSFLIGAFNGGRYTILADAFLVTGEK